MHFFALLALAAPLVAGMAFTDPAANATVTKGTKYDLTWSTVDTDPDTFSIYLVNFVNWPPYYTPLALDVETAAGEAQVYVPCDVDDSYGFQFNAINGTNVYVIYAQTPKFTIAGDSCTDPSASVTASTCAAASTVTVTVSTTLSSSGWAGNGTATVTGVGATGSGKVAVAATTTTASSTAKVTVGAACPNTIGWGASGYSYPVTLSTVPVEPAAATGAVTTKAAVLAGSHSKAPYGYTSVVYSTVYMDMSEVEDPGSCQC